LNTALVTGAIDHSHAVAMALKREGFDAFAWEGPRPGEADGLLPGSVNCYVQLAPASASRPAAGAQPVGVGTLVHGVDTVARVSPLLAPDAIVVLVTGEPGWDRASRRVLHAIAEAVVAKQVGSGARVIVVDNAEATAIAAAARRERGPAGEVSLADLAPDMAYVDWRDEVFNLTSSTGPTYFGWRRPDGARRTAVLRRSVLSPLPGADDGAHGLARAVLIDALGASAAGDLQDWAESLADDFLDEIIASLPAEEFELPIHEVATWVLRRSLIERDVLER
jgi:hypothetical protein